MSALSSLMVQDHVLTVSQIEQALQRQVIFGGDLGTNLLEMGLVDEDILLEYTGRVVRQPVLRRADFDRVDPAAVRLMPWRLASDRRIMPVRFRDETAVMACASPPPAEAIEETSAALGVEVAFHLAMDFRLAMALNSFFGIPIPARLAALQKRYAPSWEPDREPLVPPPGAPDQRPESAAGPLAVAPPEQPIIIVESSAARDRSAESTIKFITRGEQREDTAPRGRKGTGAASPPPKLQPPRRLGFSEAVAELERARTRDEILRTLFDFASQAFDYSALFIVHGGLAQGRLAARRGSPAVDIEDVSMSLDGEGMLHTVHETRGFHLGPPGDAPADRNLLARLERERPTNCAVIPVSLRQRIVLLLYGDSGKRGVRASRVARLADFGREVARAFERILLAQKLGKFRRPTGADRTGVAAPGPVLATPRTSEKKPDLAVFQAKDPPRTPSLVPVGKARLSPAGAAKIGPADILEAKDWPAPSTPPSRPPGPAGPDPAPGEEQVWRDTLPIADTAAEAKVAGATAFDPTRHPAKDLVRRVDAMEVSPDYRTSEETETFRAASTGATPESPAAPAESSPPAVLVQRVISVGEYHAEATAPAEPEPAPESEPEPQPGPETAIEPAPAPRSVMVEMGAEIEHLIRRVLSRSGFDATGTVDEEAAGLLLGIGEDALARLIRHFPGPLFHDRYRDPNRSRPVTQYGPLLALLARFGERAVPYLLPLTDSYDSEVRFFSTSLFAAIPHPVALPALGKRVFDGDRQIRLLAVDIIARFEHFPEYRWAVQELAAALTSPGSTLERKRTVAEALGRLQAPFTVQSLAEMLGSVDGVLAERCQRALVRTTFNDFGFSERRWLTWWQSNRGRHRIEWALDSVNHRREEIRLHAIDELKRMVGDVVEWPSGPPDHRQRKEIRRLVEEWWERAGRTLHPPSERG